MALLGMPDFELLGILGVKYRTVEPRRDMGEVNEQGMEDMSCTKNSNSNPTINNKDNIDYFVAGPEIMWI